MILGYLQQQIVKLGKKKGFVTNMDVNQFYPKQEIPRQMSKLVALGYFEPPEDCITFIKWMFKHLEKAKKTLNLI